MGQDSQVTKSQVTKGKPLAWGKPTIYYQLLGENDTISESKWVELPTPKEDSTSITPVITAEAKVEGGEIYDQLKKYEIKFSLFGTKKDIIPLDENDRVAGFLAIKVVPQTEGALKAQINKIRLFLKDSYTPKEGFLLEYSGSCPKNKLDIL